MISDAYGRVCPCVCATVVLGIVSNFSMSSYRIFDIPYRIFLYVEVSKFRYISKYRTSDIYRSNELPI